MREVRHARGAARLVFTALVTMSALVVPGQAVGQTPGTLDSIPLCRHVRPRPPWQPVHVRPGQWQQTLDERGWLSGFQLRLPGGNAVYGTGSNAFLEGPFDGTAVVGERSAQGTRLHFLDWRRGCAFRRQTIGSLVFGVQYDPAADTTWLSTVEPATRRELGVWRLTPSDHGRYRLVVAPPRAFGDAPGPRSVQLALHSGGRIATRWCDGPFCEDDTDRSQASDGPDVGDIESAAKLPLVDGRPTPMGESWPPQTVLHYDWNDTTPPPGWMRSAIRAATDDANNTIRARNPWIHFNVGAHDTFRYTSSFPAEGCSQAIACASRDIPNSWTIRFRPHGFEFRWGTLHWCQATLVYGCMDVERVALHEVGHIFGLQHPEGSGFRMRPLDTVMHQVVPARDNPGWSMKAYGRCDVAAYQERYGTPTMSTKVSACEDLVTKITLSASASPVGSGQAVQFRARLRTVDGAGYGQLGNMPLNFRSVQLRRRRAGVGGGWTTSWMSQSDEQPGTYELTFHPSFNYEYQAVFSRPADEGLRGDSSNILTVQVTNACTGVCSDMEDGI